MQSGFFVFRPLAHGLHFSCKLYYMIQQIAVASPNTAVFRITGEVTKENYDNLVFPVVDKMSKSYPEVNLVLIVATELKNFTIGAWMKDALLGIKHLTKWGRVAMVNDTEFVKASTVVLDKITPAEFKQFASSAEQEAITWASGA